MKTGVSVADRQPARGRRRPRREHARGVRRVRRPGDRRRLRHEHELRRGLGDRASSSAASSRPACRSARRALVGRTARLTRVDLVPPRSPVGRSTVEAIQSGPDLRHRGRGRRDRRADPRGARRARRHGRRHRRARPGRDPALPHDRPLRAVAHARGPPPGLREEHRCLRNRPAGRRRCSRRVARASSAWATRRAFAITLADVLDVAEPTRSSARARRAPRPRRRHADRRRRHASPAASCSSATWASSSSRRSATGTATCRSSSTLASLPADDFALFQEVDLGDIIGATGHGRHDAQGRAQRLRHAVGDADEGAPPPPGEVGRPAGSRSPTATPLPAPDHRRGAARRVPRARRRAQDDPRVCSTSEGFVEFEGPMLQTIAGGANARPFTTHHHALDIPMKLRISLELYLKRMLVGGVERDLRARPHLPQRRHRPRPQPRVHDARGLPGLRRLPHDDGALRDVGARVRPRREPDPRPSRRRSRDPCPRADDRPRRTVRADHRPRLGVGGRRRGGHARPPGPARDRGAPRRRGRAVVGPRQDRAGAVREARRGHDRAADLRVRLPARGLAARASRIGTIPG